MGKNNNRNVKVIQRVDSEEELKQITLARKEAMQKKAKKEKQQNFGKYASELGRRREKIL